MEAWKKSKDLTKHVYDLVKEFPDEEKYHLVSQIKRAAISVPSNLAEGNSRDTKKEKLRYVSIAYGSLMELYNHLLISEELEFLNVDEMMLLKPKIFELSKIINGLRRSLK